jgi:hypothetical protein
MDSLADKIDTAATNMQTDLANVYALTQSTEAEEVENFYSRILD